MGDISASHPWVAAHTHSILLLRHELASRGHLLHICGHCRLVILKNSPKSGGSRWNGAVKLSYRGADAQMPLLWSIERIVAAKWDLVFKGPANRIDVVPNPSESVNGVVT